MRSVAGCLAMLLTLSWVPGAQEGVSREEHQRTVRDLKETRQHVYALESALSDASLQKMAIAVGLATRGESRLLLGSGVGANPRLGRIPMVMGRGNAPFITVYPVSHVRAANLPDLGLCEIQGAVRLTTGARTSDKNSCEAGCYLFALKGGARGALILSLLNAEVDAAGQIHYREALQVPAERIDKGSGRVSAAFPDRNEVSQAHPAWQVKIELPGNDGAVRAYMNLDITML